MYKLALAAILALISLPAMADKLYTEVSKPGETADQFAYRISRKAVAISNMRGKEVCGAIVQTPAGYTIDMQSDTDSVLCSMDRVDGMIATYHTHTDKGGDAFAPADYNHTGYMAKGVQRGKTMVLRVQYQSGAGTERMISRK